MHLKWEEGAEHAFGGGKKGRINVAFSFNALHLLMGSDVIFNKNSIRIVESIREKDLSLK